MNQKKIISISGILAILGGILLFTGDMLLYYNGNQTDKLLNMATVSNERIILSGVLALLSTWFYLFGLLQVNNAFQPVSASIRQIVVLLFGDIFIAYGVIHGAYMAIATTAKLGYHNHLDLMESAKLAIDINNTIRLCVYPLFAVLSAIFIYQVWHRKTLYPRWMIFFFPLLPLLLKNIIWNNLDGKWQIIIAGGYYNLILILFFAASTVALWNKKL